MLMHRLQRFWKDRQGAVAPMLGIAIIPLMGAVGAAIDYKEGELLPVEMPEIPEQHAPNGNQHRDNVGQSLREPATRG